MAREYLSIRSLLAGWGIAATSLVMACSQPPQAKQPNIIYILADDLGYGDLGSYGQQMIKTPALDRMAAGGMRFTQHYAGSTVCAPSRAALMTGLHTGHTPVRGNKEVRPMGQVPLPDSVHTIAEHMRDAGYETALIGKWGLGAPESEGIPNRQGFDYFYGYLCQRHAHNYYPEFLFRNEERVPLSGNVMPEPKRGDGAGVATQKALYSHDLMVEETLQFIGKKRDKPFFLMLTLTIPHANNEAREKGMEVPDLGAYANQEWPEPERGKAAMISRMDADIGRVMQALKDAGIDEKTLVIFTSDNGPHREGGVKPDFFDSNGPLRGIKRDLYEGGIRVPMIAYWPGTVAPGSTSEHVSVFWDVLPTAVAAAGRSVPEGIDGISFLPALLGEQQPQHEYLYWEFHWWKPSKQAIRAGNWKAVRHHPEGELELYDLANDPGEQNNLAGQRTDVVAQMTAIMADARIDDPAWPLRYQE